MPDPEHKQDNRMSRRSFMKWMGAGAALHAFVLPACKRANEYLVPCNASPEWTLPGVPTRYSTCMPDARGALPLMAVCRDGRPVQLEPQSWLTESPGLPAHVQATILELYDPSRSSVKTFQGGNITDDEFHEAFAVWAGKISSGGKTAFIFGENDSPLRQMMVGEIRRKNPHAKFYSWEPYSRRNIDAATQEALGINIVQIPRFSHARRVLSLDCDFLAHDRQGYIGDFMKNRVPEGAGYRNTEGDYNHLSRLYAAEARFSQTGAMADERLPVAPSQIPLIVRALSRIIGQTLRIPYLAGLVPDYTPLDGETARWIRACASDLCSHRGQSLILLGSQYPVELHRLILSVNAALDASGITLGFLQKDSESWESPATLHRAIADGDIDTLFVLCPGDLLAEAPAEWRIGDCLASDGLTSVRLSLYRDQTSEACTWHLPAAHYLESWGIERDQTGRYLFRQPVIPPLYNGIAEEELLNGLLHSRGVLFTASNQPDPLSPVYQKARRCFEQAAPAASNRETAWAEALRTGHWDGTAYPRVMKPVPEPDQHVLASCREMARINAPDPSKGEYDIQFVPDYSIYDGRYARNAWLRECPDPITGLSWDVPAQCSPATLMHLSGNERHKKEQVLTINHRGAHCDYLIDSIPGTARGVIILPSGFAEEGELNSHAAALRRLSDNGTYLRINASHLALKEGDSQPARQPPAIIDHSDSPVPLFHAHAAPTGKTSKQPTHQTILPHGDTLHQWAMTIDLTLCLGCNACLIACQAENNIPVVGKQEAATGRYMNWIRIDRYFISTNDANGKERTVFLAQPVACQQCEKAPCESVCPVNATTHTSEGISAMVYPRCWGTRYCAANCPYKARRFNFLDYAGASHSTAKPRHNPNVTVRSRGVMEKCSYCVQRIEEAKSAHKAALMDTRSATASLGETELRLPLHAVKTACQLACPAGAISFGNLLREEDVVSQARQSGRSSALLERVGTKPRTTYLGRTINQEQSTA